MENKNASRRFFMFSKWKLRAPLEKLLLCTLRLGFAATVIFVPGTSGAQTLVTNPLDKKLKATVDRYNAGLPAMVAPSLRQDKVTVFNGVMNYSYTDVKKTAAELAPMNLAVTQRPYIFPEICKAPDTGRLLREGVSFRYLYYGRDGKLAAQLVFLPSDCAAVR